MNVKLVCGWLIAGGMLGMPPVLWGASAPKVKTDAGVFEGKQVGSVHAFLGIRYAAPPLGDLRWKPPAPLTKGGGVRK
ncbi:MAG TPA: carboxylesterase family protein, partial [Candidatus Acidoferrum sp.]|nr:carboxylesterase family protein [Candidatus Acidoferrum sp.]